MLPLGVKFCKVTADEVSPLTRISSRAKIFPLKRRVKYIKDPLLVGGDKGV